MQNHYLMCMDMKRLECRRFLSEINPARKRHDSSCSIDTMYRWVLCFRHSQFNLTEGRSLLSVQTSPHEPVSISSVIAHPASQCLAILGQSSLAISISLVHLRISFKTEEYPELHSTFLFNYLVLLILGQIRNRHLNPLPSQKG
jgi:hypothetical protein